MNRIIVIAPHPDDETLGCGGTILKHKADGDEIHWMIMTNISVEAGYDREKVSSRQQEIGTVAEKYGFKSISKLDLPAAGLDVIPRGMIIKTVADVMKILNRTLFIFRTEMTYILTTELRLIQ